MAKRTSLCGARWLIWLLVLLSSATACGSQNVNLPFSTIAQTREGDGGMLTYRDKRPELQVIASREEARRYARKLTQADVDKLLNLDYDHFFAIMVLRGYDGMGHSLQVQRVSRQGNQVTVQAQFVHPPTSDRKWGFNSPFHLVAVPKEGAWGQPVHFTLDTGTWLNKRNTHVIP